MQEVCSLSGASPQPRAAVSDMPGEEFTPNPQTKCTVRPLLTEHLVPWLQLSGLLCGPRGLWTSVREFA